MDAKQERAYRRKGRFILALILIMGVLTLCLAALALFFQPFDSQAISLLFVVLLFPLITSLVRQFQRARARVFFAPITSTQLSDLHERIQVIAEQMGVQPAPPAFLVADPSVNPCSKDFGARPSILIGTDFFAGCRENDAPEALDFMIAHQIAHQKAGHGTHAWSMVVATVRVVPVLNTYVARYLEFYADAIAAQYVPQGAAGALGLCLVSKDNFPYLDPAVQVRSEEHGRGLWARAAKWSVSTVSAPERFARLVHSGAVTLPQQGR